MKKMLTFLMASAISLGMAMGQETFLYSHYYQDFSTVPVGDWGTVDKDGNAAFATGFNVNQINQNLELKAGGTSIARNTGRSMYKQVWTTPLSSPDSLQISFIFLTKSTVSSSTQYLYILDSNKKPIFGLNADRSKNASNVTAWYPRLALVYKNLADSTKNFYLDNTNGPILSSSEGAFQIVAVIHFDTKTYSIKATKGTYTPTASTIFVPGTSAPFVKRDVPFLDATASDFSWMMNSIAYNASSGSYSTTNNWCQLDSITVNQVKPYIGDANVNVNYIDQNGSTFKTKQVSVPIGQKYTVVGSNLVSFHQEGSYYIYDASNTSSLSTISTVDGLASVNLRFTKSPSLDSPFTWAAKNDTASWNEIDANFVSLTNVQTPYQLGKEVVFNGADTTQLVRLASPMDLYDKNWVINGGKLSFQGLGSVKTTGNLILNLNATDSVRIENRNLISGDVHVKGGYTHIAAGALGSGKVYIEENSELFLIGDNSLSTTTDIAAGKTLTIRTKGETNGQGIGGYLTGNGDLKIKLNNVRGNFSVNMTNWGGKKITVVSTPGTQTGNQILLMNSDSARAGLAKRQLYLDSLILVGAAYTVNTTTSIGALSGTPKAILGALTDGGTNNKSTFWKIGGLNLDTEFEGIISNQQYKDASTVNRVHVEKAGTGVLTLTNSELSYSGNTVVSAGTLVLKGRLTSGKDTVSVAEGAKLVVIGKRELDALGSMQQTGGIISGDVHVVGTIESQGGKYNGGNGLFLTGAAKFVAKVENDSVPCATFLACMIEPNCILEIKPVVSYKSGDVFRVFPKEIADGSVAVAGTFGTVVDADKWDISKLYTDGTVVALAGHNLAVKDVQKEKIRAYFTEGTLQVTGLQAGDTYKVFNTSGMLVDSTVKLQKGIYIVAVKTAKGIVKLKVANF